MIDLRRICNIADQMIANDPGRQRADGKGGIETFAVGRDQGIRRRNRSVDRDFGRFQNRLNGNWHFIKYTARLQQFDNITSAEDRCSGRAGCDGAKVVAYDV